MSLLPIDSPERQARATELLVEGFPEGAAFWRQAFLAPPGRLGHGVLQADQHGTAVGVLLLFEGHRLVAGARRRVVNLSSWYLRPEHRALAPGMMRDAIADKSAIYTNLSANDRVQKLNTALGFRYAWRGAHQSVPLLNGFSSGRGVTIADADPAARPPQIQLTPTDRVPLPERYVWVKARVRDQVADVVWRILPWRGRRIGQLAYCSDHQVLRRALAALHWHLLFRHRMLALLLPMLPVYAGLKSVRKSPYGPVAMVRGDIPDEQVDMLQTEFHHLPLNL